MPLDQLANIAEISAAVLVIVSLMYVGLQIKQNTDTLKVGTAHNTAEDFSALYLLLADWSATTPKPVFQRKICPAPGKPASRKPLRTPLP